MLLPPVAVRVAPGGKEARLEGLWAAHKSVTVRVRSCEFVVSGLEDRRGIHPDASGVHYLEKKGCPMSRGFRDMGITNQCTSTFFLMADMFIDHRLSMKGVLASGHALRTGTILWRRRPAFHYCKLLSTSSASQHCVAPGLVCASTRASARALSIRSGGIRRHARTLSSPYQRTRTGQSFHCGSSAQARCVAPHHLRAKAERTTGWPAGIALARPAMFADMASAFL